MNAKALLLLLLVATAIAEVADRVILAEAVATAAGPRRPITAGAEEDPDQDTGQGQDRTLHVSKCRKISAAYDTS